MELERLKNQEVQDWIETHKFESLHRLAFKKSPFEYINMQDLLQQIQGRKIASKKFPDYDKKGIIFPPKINLEQTSSKITADYKASLVNGEVIVDITGGLGIDCTSFASKFRQVYHIESNRELQAMAKSNFSCLGLKNIQSFSQDGIMFINEYKGEIDVLYIDPSRRDGNKNRVFLLEEMTPDLLQHSSMLQEKAKTILLKLSPLIDLSYLIQTLPNIQEIHIVAVKNEVKEVLVKIQIFQPGSVRIYAVNLDTAQDNFVFDAEHAKGIQTVVGELKDFLYEPNAAIQKSGGNEILANQFNLKKLHVNTQLFTSDEFHKDFPGRIFEVGEKIKSPKKELKNQSIMAIHRNFPENLIQLRKKYKFTTDGLEPVLFARNLDHVLIQRLKFIIL